MDEGAPVRHKRSKRPSPAREFWRNYRVELVGLVAVAIGMFLLLEQLSIRGSIAAWLRGVVASASVRSRDFDREFNDLLARVSLSDLLGIALIAVAVLAVLLRLRWRLMNDPQLSGDGCPRCGGAIHRVHRKWYDRWISLYLPVRRYRCYEQECGWKGLKVGRHHGSGKPRVSAPS